MTKTELIKAVVAKKPPRTRSGEVEDIINTTLDKIMETLASGAEVNITGFGKFEVKQQAARQGRNPKTGATIEIAARNVPKFRAGKALKDAVK